MLSWLYDVRLDTKGIRFILLFFTVHLLQFETIKCVSEIGPASIGSITAYNFKNRLLARSFLIETRRGWFTRKVLVTPKDPDAFLKVLKEHNVDLR